METKVIMELKETQMDYLVLAKKELGLFDSDTDKSVLALKIVDATALCVDSERCVIKYADVSRGRIAQICDWYEAEKDLGTSVHYFISENTAHTLALDSVFERSAICMGVDPIRLAGFIFDNQPEVSGFG